MGEGFQQILYSLEHQGVDDFLVFPCQISQMLRQGEGDQVVLAWQPFFDLVFQPLLAFVVLAMGEIAVTTGMGNIDPLTALVIRTASQHVQTMLVAASGHSLQCFDMAWQEIFLVAAVEAVLESVDDRGEQHHLSPPHLMSTELIRELTTTFVLLAVAVLR